MSDFLSTDEFSVYKNSDNNLTFTLKFTQNSESLINSIIKTKQIIATNINDDYTILSFRASSVKSFKKFMTKNKNITYENSLMIILSLTKQFQYLIISEHKCFYQYIIENIIVIDNFKFIYLSNEDLINLSNSNKLFLSKPFNRNGFISPEIFNIKTIPAEVDFKTIYYSLGALIIYFLFNKNININKNIFEDLKEILQPIKGTKLFGLISRCLFEEIERRAIIYI
jgi:hypothetical protein